MKCMMTIMTLALSTALYAATPEVIISPVDHLFVPQGFDNNDNVEVVVTGSFPNPCYIKNTVDVKVVDEKIFVEVTALKRDAEKSGLCDPMTIPFKEQITIGNLQGGEYEIIVNESSPFEQRGQLEVGVSSSSSVDDHLYPIVEYIELGFTGGAGGEAFIIAKAPSRCMVLDEVKYVSNKKDTISILPIMKKISQICTKEMHRIQIPIKFNLKNLKNKDVLLFVRSIEGKSVNNIINQ